MAKGNQNAKKTEQASSTQERKHTTLRYTTKMQSDFMRAYIDKNIGSLIMLYGRIGGLLRLVQDDVPLSTMVEDWVLYNDKLAYYQLEEASALLEQIQMQSANRLELDVQIDRPEPLESTWQVNHSCYTNLIRLMLTIDKFILQSEEMYFKGMMSDVQMNQINRQVDMVISSYLERILKATSPGKHRDSNGYRYKNQDLLAHIKDAGYRLEFHALPKELEGVVSEYNQRYSKYKSLVDERLEKARAKTAERKEQSEPDKKQSGISEAV